MYAMNKHDLILICTKNFPHNIPATMTKLSVFTVRGNKKVSISNDRNTHTIYYYPLL